MSTTTVLPLMLREITTVLSEQKSQTDTDMFLGVQTGQDRFEEREHLLPKHGSWCHHCPFRFSMIDLSRKCVDWISTMGLSPGGQGKYCNWIDDNANETAMALAFGCFLILCRGSGTGCPHDLPYFRTTKHNSVLCIWNTRYSRSQRFN